MAGPPLPLEFTVESVPYDVDYIPGGDSRATTNFANFARDPATRRSNIATFLASVKSDLNGLLDDDPNSGRFEVALEIVSVTARVTTRPEAAPIPLSEVMRATVLDTRSGETFDGPTGMNFSSYLRDYDFRVVLPELLARNASQRDFDGFGRLHGVLTRMQFGAGGAIPETLTVAISISQNRPYRAMTFCHPVLGREYCTQEPSVTDGYFRQMGLVARYFRPAGLPAPLAIYADGSLCRRSDAFLAALVAVMANFQRIYRPEIYLSREAFSELPGQASRASLSNLNYELPAIGYDRQEREVLADHQAREIEARLLRPHADLVERLQAEQPGF